MLRGYHPRKVTSACGGSHKGGKGASPRGNSKAQSRRLERVFRRFRGLCQSCGVRVLTVRRARWQRCVVDMAAGVILAPDGLAFGVATVQHLTPLSRGGTNHGDNLSLWCQACNAADNRRVQAGGQP